MSALLLHNIAIWQDAQNLFVVLNFSEHLSYAFLEWVLL
jgi:hypothetical protein